MEFDPIRATTPFTTHNLIVAMKILHTSDWHLGHTLYNYDRTEEQRDMLRQMVEIVSKERPDVFLLAGDIYHTPQPSAAVQTMFTNALVEIHRAHRDMTIIITAGNHDSGTKHEIFRTPWRALNVHAIGNIDKESADEQIIKIADKGYIVAIPYTNERNIPEGYFQKLLDAVAERNIANLPVVMSAHTTIRGCDFSGNDHASEYTVGGVDAWNVEDIGEGYDYLALGHIHNEQFVHTGKHNVRYCGTPIAISFDEKSEHSVSIVDIDNHNDTPRVRRIAISNPRPLVSLPTEGFASWEKAKQLLKEFPDDIAAYIRLNVEIEDFLPAQANAEAMALTEGKQCRFCHINGKRKTSEVATTRTMTVQEFQEEAPIDIAKQYASYRGFDFSDEMEAMFNEVLAAVEDDARNN